MSNKLVDLYVLHIKGKLIKYILLSIAVLALLSLLLLWFLAGGLSGLKVVFHEGKFENRHYHSSIPFRLDKNRIIIPVMLQPPAGKETQDTVTVSALIDSKAAGVLLHTDFVQKYSAYYIGSRKVNKSADGQPMPSNDYYAMDFDVDVLRFGQNKVLDFDLSILNRVCQKREFDMLLGKSFLHLHNLYFDMENLRVEMTDSLGYFASMLPQCIPHQSKMDYLTWDFSIRLALAPIEDDFTIDLGFNGDVHIDEKGCQALMQDVAYAKKASVWYGYLYQGLGEQKVDTCVEWTGVDAYIGNHLLRDISVIRHQKIDKKLVGVGLIRRFNFILAYRDEKMYLKPIASVNTTDATHGHTQLKKGVSFGEYKGEVIVNRLRKSGLAEQVGLHIGDVVLAFNGVAIDPAQTARLCESLEQLNECGKETIPLRLQLRRSNQVLEATL